MLLVLLWHISCDPSLYDDAPGGPQCQCFGLSLLFGLKKKIQVMDSLSFWKQNQWHFKMQIIRIVIIFQNYKT